MLGGATADDALVDRIVERTKAAEVAPLRERATAAEAEAAALRAMLGISNAVAQGTMEQRVKMALNSIQRGSATQARCAEPVAPVQVQEAAPAAPAVPAVVAAVAAATERVRAQSSKARQCCDAAPSEKVRVRWEDYETQIDECCAIGWQTIEELQSMLHARNVHTQHKALKSFVGRNPALRLRAFGMQA